MTELFQRGTDGRVTFHPANLSGRLTYRHGEANRCPNCTHSSWLIGRSSAECAVCNTNIPFVTGGEPRGIGALRMARSNRS